MFLFESKDSGDQCMARTRARMEAAIKEYALEGSTPGCFEKITYYVDKSQVQLELIDEETDEVRGSWMFSYRRMSPEQWYAAE